MTDMRHLSIRSRKTNLSSYSLIYVGTDLPGVFQSIRQGRGDL